MPNISKSAKLYQERRQPDIRKTYRGPSGYINLDQNPPVTLNLDPPFPRPDTQHDNSAPDNTRTVVWPFGDNHAV